MGVSAEVAKHLLGSAERGFAVDHPAWNMELADKTPKESRLSQASEQAVELELSGGVSLLERHQEFPTEALSENREREEKLLVPGAEPVGVIRR